MYIRWSGGGCLLYVIVFATIPAAYGIVQATAAVTGSRNVALAQLAVGVMLLPIAALTWGLGRLMNAGGNRHTLMGAPVQAGSGLFLVVAFVLFCLAIGQVATWLGWVALVGVPVGALFLWAAVARARLRAGVKVRRELARQRGWRWADDAAELRERWKDDQGQQTYGRGAFGVLAGELEGLPLTVWETHEIYPNGKPASASAGKRCTGWAVHLPVAYPSLLMGADGPVTEHAEFGHWLWTTDVWQTTNEGHLIGWRLDGRDLILIRAAPEPTRPFTADEVLATATALVRLARTFPADLADRFGTALVTGIPLAGQGATARRGDPDRMPDEQPGRS